MDELEERLEEAPRRPGILPALLFAWVTVYVVVLLGIGWHTCWESVEPDDVLRFHAFTLGSLALIFLAVLFGARGGAPVPAEPEAWLCQHCLKPYVPGAHFCPRCGAPKTWYSGVPDYERAYAQAWILGKAAHHPSRGLHVAGLVLLASGGLAWVVYEALEFLGRDSWWSRPTWVDWGGLAFVALDVFLVSALAVYALGNWRRVRRKDALRPESEYGSPPWFTNDVEWALPEFEEDPEDDATTAAG